MAGIRSIGLKGRQLDAAARYPGITRSRDYISAHRADIQQHFFDIHGFIAVNNSVAGEELGKSNIQCSCKGLKKHYIRQASAGFPFGYRFIAYMKPLGKLHLCESGFFTEFTDNRGSNIAVYCNHTPLAAEYLTEGSKATYAK